MSNTFRRSIEAHVENCGMQLIRETPGVLRYVVQQRIDIFLSGIGRVPDDEWCECTCDEFRHQFMAVTEGIRRDCIAPAAKYDLN